MNLPIQQKQLHLKVIPQAGRTALIEENGKIKLYLKAAPDKNKANRELITFFKKEFGLVVSIKSGAHSREKVIEIIR